MGLVGRSMRIAGLLTFLGVFAGVPLGAETTSDQTGSIVLFPKVVFDGERETLIQMSSTHNMVVYAHCFYVNAAPLCTGGAGDCVAGTCSGRCEPQWQEIDFDLIFTKQQPTHWLAGEGRFADPLEPPCDPITPNYDCDGAGILLTRIPPVTRPFVGELRCVEVDASGAPSSGNHLKGEATLLTRDGDASQYNALALRALTSNEECDFLPNNGDRTLCLGGGVSDECWPCGAEYEPCPAEMIVNHFSEDADSPLFGPTSTVETELTLVPCEADYERQEPSRVVVHFDVTNEFEQPLSAVTTVDCWKSFRLSEVSNIFNVRTVGTRLLQTRLRPSSASTSGLVGVVEEHHAWEGARARAAFNLHERGDWSEGDLMVLPQEPGP